MPEIMDMDTEPTKPAQTTAPVTEPTGWMSPTGEIRDGAPEAVRNLLEAKKWTNVEQLATGYVDLEKFTGIGEHLVIPEVEDASGWNNVYNQLGRPETYDKYELSYDGDMPISDELVGQFKQFAHGLGLTQRQFEEAVKFQLDTVVAQTEAYNAQLATQQEENIAALKQKWGEVNYEVKVKGARIIADSLGIYQTLEAKGLASDPVIIEMLDTIASRTSEDVITPQPPAAAQKSPLEELGELKKSEPFLQKFHREHKTCMARFMELNQLVVNAGQAQQPKI